MLLKYMKKLPELFRHPVLTCLVTTEFVENDEENGHHNDDAENNERVADRLQRHHARVVRLSREWSV